MRWDSATGAIAPRENGWADGMSRRRRREREIARRTWTWTRLGANGSDDGARYEPTPYIAGSRRNSISIPKYNSSRVTNYVTRLSVVCDANACMYVCVVCTNVRVDYSCQAADNLSFSSRVAIERYERGSRMNADERDSHDITNTTRSPLFLDGERRKGKGNCVSVRARSRGRC